MESDTCRSGTPLGGGGGGGGGLRSALCFASLSASSSSRSLIFSARSACWLAMRSLRSARSSSSIASLSCSFLISRSRDAWLASPPSASGFISETLFRAGGGGEGGGMRTALSMPPPGRTSGPDMRRVSCSVRLLLQETRCAMTPYGCGTGPRARLAIGTDASSSFHDTKTVQSKSGRTGGTSKFRN